MGERPAQYSKGLYSKGLVTSEVGFRCLGEVSFGELFKVVEHTKKGVKCSKKGSYL